MIERLGKVNNTVFPIVGPQRLRHLLKRPPTHSDAVFAEKPGLQNGVDVVRFARRGRAQILSRTLEQMKIIGLVAEEVVDDGIYGTGEEGFGCTLRVLAHNALDRSAVNSVEAKELFHQLRGMIDCCP